jgi:hypothetical protein
MAQSVTITSLNASLPANIFIADYYGNNRTFVGSITATTQVPSTFDFSLSAGSVPMVTLIVVDSQGCESNSKIDCTI